MRVTALVDEVREALSLPEPGVARRIRRLAGVSQGRLADELGVTRQTVYRWEAGNRVPRSGHRLSYARLLADLERATRRYGGTV